MSCIYRYLYPVRKEGLSSKTLIYVSFVCAHTGLSVEIRGEFRGVGSLLLPCGFLASNLGVRLGSKSPYLLSCLDSLDKQPFKVKSI